MRAGVRSCRKAEQKYERVGRKVMDAAPSRPHPAPAAAAAAFRRNQKFHHKDVKGKTTQVVAEGTSEDK